VRLLAGNCGRNQKSLQTCPRLFKVMLRSARLFSNDEASDRKTKTAPRLFLLQFLGTGRVTKLLESSPFHCIFFWETATFIRTLNTCGPSAGPAEPDR